MKKDSEKADPEQLPAPTWWPVLLALGLTCTLWGILTNFVVSVIGICVFGVALGGWITDLYYEQKNDK